MQRNTVFLNGDPTFEFPDQLVGSVSTGQFPSVPHGSFGGPKLFAEPSTIAGVGGHDLVFRGSSAVFLANAIPVDPARKYKMKAWLKRDAHSSGSPKIYIGFKNLTNDFAVDGLSATGTSRSGNTYCVMQGQDQTSFPIGDWELVQSPVITGVTLDDGGQGDNNSFRAETAYVRPLILGNYSAGADEGNIMRVGAIWFEDVTESETAKSSAAEAKATETVVLSAKDDTQDAAATAVAASTVAASVGSIGGYHTNASFTEWTDGAVSPNGWTRYNSGTQFVARDTDHAKYKNAMLFNVVGSTNSRPQLRARTGSANDTHFIGSNSPKRVRIVAELLLLSGSWVGSAVRPFWYSTGAGGVNGASAEFDLSDYLTDTIGEVQTLDITVDRPDEFEASDEMSFMLQMWGRRSSGGDKQFVALHFQCYEVPETAEVSLLKVAQAEMDGKLTSFVEWRAIAGETEGLIGLYADCPSSDKMGQDACFVKGASGSSFVYV